MKKLTLAYFLPLFTVLICLFKFNNKINSAFFNSVPSISLDSSFNYLESCRHTPFYEDQFLNSGNSAETIFILGSSELTVKTSAQPYIFIPTHFKTKLKGIGHAGNQCFSIYSQLLANENRLKNAPIVIVLSPSWFSEYSNGTSSSLFLELNSPRFLNAILQNDSLPQFKKYEAKRISDLHDEINNSDLSIEQFFFENQSSKNFLSKCFYFPFVGTTKILNKCKLALMNTNYKKITPIERKAIVPESIKINWDSLFTTSKQEQLNNSTNNKWYIDNDYYTNYVKSKTSLLTIAKDENKNNQELEDFKMLLKLLKTKEVNASFIISPLNPFYYTNSKALTPLVNSIQTDIAKSNFPCLNLWNDDSTHYDIGILKDVMHLSSYGWYKADKFIIETYKLSK